MTGKPDISDERLQSLFDEVRKNRPEVSDSLYARILHDAGVVQKDVVPEQVTGAPGVLSSMLRAIGGWGSLGGMVAAAAAGIWIGFSNPTLVAPSLESDNTVQNSEFFDDLASGELMFGDSLFFEEG